MLLFKLVYILSIVYYFILDIHMSYTNILIHILGIVNLIMLKLHDNVSMKELYYIINVEYHTVLFYFI